MFRNNLFTLLVPCRHCQKTQGNLQNPAVLVPDQADPLCSTSCNGFSFLPGLVFSLFDILPELLLPFFFKFFLHLSSNFVRF